MERRLVVVAGVAIVAAGSVLHFVYGWSGRNALAGLVSPVNESAWEHTKLLVVPVVVAGALGTGAILWVDIASFVLIVAGGQWLHLRVLRSGQVAVSPVVSVLGVLVVLAVYAIFTVTPPALPVFQTS